MRANETVIPQWRKDFPIRRQEELVVTRRQLGRLLGFTSAGILAAALFTALRIRLWPATPARPLRIAAADEIPIGGYKLFRYPTADDPAILLRLGESQFVAFSQLCTHLSCPVHLARDRQRLVCPCHHGVFAAEDGRVLGGPPTRPLPKIPVGIRDGAVWA